MPTAHRIDPLKRANLSLAGLSTGDAFGEALMSAYVDPQEALEIPPGPWRWTDDTNMGLSIVEVLTRHGGIDQDALAHSFIKRFMEQPHRGYGRGAYHLLRAMANGRDWREATPIVFPGGSKGNGAAMRAGPIGGYFGADPPRAAAQARASAEVTHAHPEGQAGAMAVAAAAAIASRSPVPSARDFLTEVLGHVPQGATAEGIARSLDFAPEELDRAAQVLGTGLDITAPDTVPYCLWCAAHHLGDYEAALWFTVSSIGDRDTTCAIVGSIVALSSGGVPPLWLERRESLPPGF
jgi:ADP-ribosylglycohydrolase